ncbi:MAG: hypothetical protein QOH71_2601 [Blastocatellia bacterium]|jgi:hypothetical protein|nr:hypothetical protein [Blastocatellia bacterium]
MSYFEHGVGTGAVETGYLIGNPDIAIVSDPVATESVSKLRRCA